MWQSRLKFLTLYRSHGWSLALVVGVSLVASALYFPFAALLRRLFDSILLRGDLPSVWWTTAGLFAIQVLLLAAETIARRGAQQLAETVSAQARQRAMEVIYNWPQDAYLAADLSRVELTLTHDSQELTLLTQSLWGTAVPSLLAGLVTLLLLARLEWRYALALGVLIPLLLVLHRARVRDIWFRQERARQALEDYARGVRFALAAFTLARQLAARDRELDRNSARIRTLEQARLSFGALERRQHVEQSLLLFAATLAILLLGGIATVQGELQRGDMMVFYLLAALFSSQARAAVSAVPEIRRGLRAYAALDGILAAAPTEPYVGTLAPEPLESLEIRDVSFSYDGPAVFENVNFRLPRGGILAITGPNGSGKSTLVSLLLGLYLPRFGNLLWNGHPYSTLDIHGIRRRIALVPQHPFFFASSIRENLLYGRPGTTPEAIAQALDLSGFASIAAQLPMGLDTPLGENGSGLSGGEKQKLSLARALLGKPDLLILDEPFNHLDRNSSLALASRLRQLPTRPAVLLITHQAEFLSLADALYSLGGRFHST